MARRYYPGKPRVRVKIKTNGFPLGNDCNQDSPADKMPLLCSASCVFIHMIAVRHFIQVSPTWHCISTSKWQGASQLPRSCARTAFCKALLHSCLSFACCFSPWAMVRTLTCYPVLSLMGPEALSLSPHSHQ